MLGEASNEWMLISEPTMQAISSTEGYQGMWQMVYGIGIKNIGRIFNRGVSRFCLGFDLIHL
jgi:hypothetical protein